MANRRTRWLMLLQPPALYLLGVAVTIVTAPLESLVGDAAARLLACLAFNSLLFAWWRVPPPLRARPRSLALGAALGVGIALPSAQDGGLAATTAVAALVVVVDAAWEELLFRGLAFDVALQRYGPLGAVTLGSVCFTGAHLLDATAAEPVALSYLLCAGVLLGAIRVVTASLWPPIVLHAAHNLTLACSTATQVHWGSVIVAAVIAIGLLVRVHRSGHRGVQRATTAG